MRVAIVNIGTIVSGDLNAPLVQGDTIITDGERLDPVGIARPPRHVHLGGADRRRHPAVHVALEVADGLLARRVVAERDMHVGVDQARDRGRSARIDDDVAGLDRLRRGSADAGDAVAVGNDRVARHERACEIARHDRADIDDGDAHGSRTALGRVFG